jgi:hypothetical protein
VKRVSGATGWHSAPDGGPPRRRLGAAGILFFLVKGLLWLAGAACLYARR